MNPGKPQEEASALGAPRRVEAAAVAWVQRRRAGLSSEERRELLAWLAADAAHARAFRAADVGRDELDWPLHAGLADMAVVELNRRRRRRRSRRWAVAGFAVALSAVALAWRPLRERADSSNFAVIEPRRQTLADGSVVELAPGAQISVEFGERVRSVTLQRGSAHFAVAPNPQRPFVVNSGRVAVRAVGTAFVVDRGDAEVRVYVTHGLVAVENPDDAPTAAAEVPRGASKTLAELSAGRFVAVTPGSTTGADVRAAIRTPSETEFDAMAGWRWPKLEFSGTPLRAVAEAMNRHNRIQFEIADDGIADLRISGTLRADKVDALIAILESDFPVRAERNGDRRILRHSR